MKKYCEYYGINDITYEEFVEDAKIRNIKIEAKSSIEMDCGDHLSDGIFENVIEGVCGSHYEHNSERFCITFSESNH